MLVQEGLSLQQKLEILTDAAKYDVACTSSGADRKGQAGSLGNAAACGICHTFSADGRCVSLLKILYTNECIYDCKYCINRASNDTVRTSFTPEEICTLTMEFYKRNYIEGLFLSSGVLRSPDYTMGQIYQALWMLRNEHHFRGYIHVKGIPGTDPALVERIGHLADRMSVNLELPTGEGLRKLAPAKTREKLLAPMRQIRNGIDADRFMLEERRREKRIFRIGAGVSGTASVDQPAVGTLGAASGGALIAGAGGIVSGGMSVSDSMSTAHVGSSAADSVASFPDTLPAGTASDSALSERKTGKYEASSLFVPAGQSTQMIIGATPETDYQLMQVTSALYENFRMKRVFYSAYTALNEDSALPDPGTKPPLLREHRLYQADWLLRFYGFRADELLSEKNPYFNPLLDPKCDWAIHHLEHFPVEVNRADYQTILRVPGIGVRSAQRIVRARRYAKLDYPDLKRMGVVLKRAAYFITCGGRMLNPTRIEEAYLTAALTADERQKTLIAASGETYQQMDLFRDFGME